MELFASAADIFFGGSGYWRRLLPVISIMREQLSAVGKTVCLLYQISLMFGLSQAALLKLCSRVRSITTDMGTERLTVQSNGIIGAYLEHMGARLDNFAEPQQLFPRALQIPGWKHMWDNVLRRSLSSVLWFPTFLRLFKAWISFFYGRRPVWQPWAVGSGSLALLVQQMYFPVIVIQHLRIGGGLNCGTVARLSGRSWAP